MKQRWERTKWEAIIYDRNDIIQETEKGSQALRMCDTLQRIQRHPENHDEMMKTLLRQMCQRLDKPSFLLTLTMGSGVGRVNKSKGSNKRAKRKRSLARAVDQIAEDISDPMRAEALRTDQPIDFDLPGLGQHYCVECARYFVGQDVLVQHCRTKIHKNRVKELREQPYSQEEAEAAAGMAPNDNGVQLQAL